jgi:isochorismate hydrolase
MQEPFLRDAWEQYFLVKNVSILLEAARVLRIPVAPTLQNKERMGGPIEDVEKRLPSGCIPYDKMSFSCLGADAIASEIRRSGRKQILICGVEAHICVCQTALDLIQEGYQVHIAADAVSSRTQQNRDLGLKRMEAAGALITTTEAAVFELLEEAGTPEFREILPLVK